MEKHGGSGAQNCLAIMFKIWIFNTDSEFNGKLNRLALSIQYPGVSQKAAQQFPAPISKEMRDKLQPKADQPVMPLGATWCASGDIVKRECMGIEPTGSFVQTPRWF